MGVARFDEGNMADEQLPSVAAPRPLAAGRSYGARVAALFGADIASAQEQDRASMAAVGTFIESKYMENVDRVIDRADDYLRRSGVSNPTTVPIAIGKPLLQAAAEEDREELVDLWARLLATSCDPHRSGQMRREFTEIVRQMNPADARVFNRIDPVMNYAPSQRSGLSSHLGLSETEVEASFVRLMELGLIRNKSQANADQTIDVANTVLRPLGTLLKHALAR
jgi:hypothetical protein